MKKSKQRISARRQLHGFVHLIGSFRRKMKIDKIDVYSAQAGFYLIMSVIPMLVLMFTLLQYTPLTKEMMMDALSDVLAPESMEYVRGVVNQVYEGSFTLMSFAAVSLLWVAGKGIMGLMNGLNNIHRLREDRNYFVLRLRCSFYTVMFVAALIVAMMFLVAGVRFERAVFTLVPLLGSFARLSLVFRILLFMLILTGIFNALYVFLPNRKKSFKSQFPGSVFATVSWLVFTYFFQIYLRLATSLSILYGGLLTIVVAMIWIYFCIYLFFFGAEINAWRENPDILPF